MVGESLAIMRWLCPLVMLPALQNQAGDANFLETVFSIVRASERDTEPGEEQKRAGRQAG